MTTAPPRADGRRGPATLVALAIGLLVSVPLWWSLGGTWMGVQDLRRWLSVVALGAVVAAGAGVALMASRRWRTVGAGLVAGTAWAILADVSWWSVALKSAED